MQKIIKQSFLIMMLSLIVVPSAFAGIPISEPNTPEQETVTSEKSKVKTKKVSKLKQKIAKKLLKKADGGNNQILAIILAIILPFVGVAVWQNGITKDFWITLLLTFLFYLPGLIYALYIILS